MVVPIQPKNGRSFLNHSLWNSFHKITPFQLCKLLELPLDVSTSLELFSWSPSQKGYRHSFDIYQSLISKLGANGSKVSSGREELKELVKSVVVAVSIGDDEVKHRKSDYWLPEEVRDRR